MYKGINNGLGSGICWHLFTISFRRPPQFAGFCAACAFKCKSRTALYLGAICLAGLSPLSIPISVHTPTILVWCVFGTWPSCSGFLCSLFVWKNQWYDWMIVLTFAVLYLLPKTTIRPWFNPKESPNGLSGGHSGSDKQAKHAHSTACPPKYPPPSHSQVLPERSGPAQMTWERPQVCSKLDTLRSSMPGWKWSLLGKRKPPSHRAPPANQRPGLTEQKRNQVK